MRWLSLRDTVNIASSCKRLQLLAKIISLDRVQTWSRVSLGTPPAQVERPDVAPHRRTKSEPSVTSAINCRRCFADSLRYCSAELRRLTGRIAVKLCVYVVL